MPRMLRSAVAAVLLSCPAVAQQPAEGDRYTPADATRQTIWERMERQGEITVGEIRDHATAVFRALDASKDGEISRTELVNEDLPEDLGRVADDPALRRQLFERLNSDRGRTVSRAEWRNALDQDLGIADLNDDGAVTLSELARVDASSVFLNMLGF